MTQNPAITWASRPEDRYHWILTLEVPGKPKYTFEGTYTPPQGWTRRDVYLAIKQAAEDDNPDLRDSSVTYFAFERNQL